MAAFRRFLVALAVLGIFAALASAQVMNCSVTSAQGNINLRSESKAELVSDMLITCTSSGVITTTTQAPNVNITVTFNTQVTSKILATTTAPAYNLSESLLLIDDPGGTGSPQVAGFGIGAAQLPCAFSVNGCVAFPNIVGGIPVMAAANNPLGSPVASANNIYQGAASGNSLTFFGVPVIPPGTQSTRTYRITNVRVNANGTSGQIFGSISVTAGTGSAGGSGAGLFSFTQTVSPPLGTSVASLTVKAAGNATLSNCTALNVAFAGNVSFTENFPNAFKPRVTPTTTAYSGQSAATLQNIPGTFTGNSESDFVPAASSAYSNGGNAASPGLADFSTRLKAVFSNIPSGTRLFVSFTNVATNSTSVASAGTVNAAFYTGNATVTTAGGAGSNASGPFAELLASGNEATPDNWPAIAATPSNGTATVPNGGGITSLGFPYVELPVSGGTATAVWEVLNSNSSLTDTLTFDVFITQAAQGPTGAVAVDQTYAPTTVTSVVPNFVDPGTTATAFTIAQCRTLLLYPYVTSAAGFDTGIAVANTTADPLGTAAQTGTCTFNYYGSPTTAATTSPTVAAGTVTAFTMSSVASNFTGYIIAVCNFQFAHGFAFVADWTSTIQSSAMGYLALVMPSTGPRPAALFGSNSEALVQ